MPLPNNRGQVLVSRLAGHLALGESEFPVTAFIEH
jgi:hypothetical protein